jgi:hypothetical protein
VYTIDQFIVNPQVCNNNGLSLSIVGMDPSTLLTSDTTSANLQANIVAGTSLETTYNFNFEVKRATCQSVTTNSIKVILTDCSYASISVPAILANTGSYTYKELVFPNNEYLIPTQFSSPSALCPITEVNLALVSGGSVADITSTDGVSLVSLTSSLTDSFIRVILPAI